MTGNWGADRAAELAGAVEDLLQAWLLNSLCDERLCRASPLTWRHVWRLWLGPPADQGLEPRRANASAQSTGWWQPCRPLT